MYLLSFGNANNTAINEFTVMHQRLIDWQARGGRIGCYSALGLQRIHDNVAFWFLWPSCKPGNRFGSEAAAWSGA